MRIPSVVLLVLVVAAGFACGKNKSQTDSTMANKEAAPVATDNNADGTADVKDLEKICHAYELASAKTDTGMTVIGPWLEQNLRTSEGKAMLEEMKRGSFETAGQEAKRHGVAPCPSLDAHGQQATP